MKNNKKYAVFSMDVEEFSDAGCLAMRNISPDNDVSDGLDNYIALLESHSIKATLFTLKTTAEKIEDKIKYYAGRGHSISVHGYDHTPLNYMGNEEFEIKTKEAKDYFEALLSRKITGFRAPFFSMDNEKIEILRSLGFRYDTSSQDFTKNYLKNKLINGAFDLSDYRMFLSGALEKDGFFEFCLPCQNILGCSFPVSGGGYMRLCPWPVARYGVKKFIKKNDLYVFYLHPFELSDNCNADLPGVPAPEKHYLQGKIKSYRKKIERIIRMLKKEGFEFTTFDELCDLYENSNKN